MMDLTKANIEAYAARYDENEPPADTIVEQEMKRVLATQRFLTKPQLVKIGLWKSPRQKKRYESNDEETVKELTAFSLSAKTEQARVGSLLALNGVSYPVASTILHFAFPGRYPILDFRALWSIGWEKPTYYTFEFWIRYCARIREIALAVGLPLRIVDKALWQYSKDHQKARPAAP